MQPRSPCPSLLRNLRTTQGPAVAIRIASSQPTIMVFPAAVHAAAALEIALEVILVAWAARVEARALRRGCLGLLLLATHPSQVSP